MGCWGMGITQSDEYCEIYERFMVEYDEGKPLAEIKQDILEEYEPMRRLELLACMAGIKTDSDEYREIVKNWKDLLLMQFHDVLPGSSINAVYDDTDKMYKDLFSFIDKEQASLIDKAIKAESDEGCVTVFNPNSFASTSYVKVDDSFKDCVLSDGENTSKVIPDGKGGYVFYAENVEGFGTKSYSKVTS